MAKKAKKAKKTAKKTAKKKKKASFDVPHSIRIASKVRCALRSTDRRQPSSQNIRATNSLTGPLCRWLLHNGPVFH